jgi:DNA-binding PadR family transcriptional regulator
MDDAFNSDLLRGSLDLMVLGVLADGPKYGYSLQQSLRAASYGRIDPKAGTLYPLLHRLEDDGLIRAKWDSSTGRKRKWYELTAAGKKRLKVQAHEWYAYAAILRRLLEPVVAPPQPA